MSVHACQATRLPPSSGKTGRRHRIRCRDCRTRFTLRRSPEQYRRAVRCPDCRSLNVRSVEMERRREVRRQKTCCCFAYPFPHRAGSLRMCHEHPLSMEQPTDEEIDAYQTTLATPRQGFM